MELFPIFIPSRGRANNCKTAELLASEGVNVCVVVEPQEAEAYKAFTCFVLPENNRGIGYVRQYILDCARRNNLSWFWMLDDDIRSGFLVKNRLCIKSKLHEVLLSAQDIFSEVKGCAQAALEYQQFAWSQKEPMKMNGYCDVAVCINVERTKAINYRPHMDLKEDRDFTLQILSRGYRTVRATHCAFAAPKNGSNKGGLQAEYARAGREAEASKRMVEAWPGICSLNTKPDGRQDVKIDWSKFKV